MTLRRLGAHENDHTVRRDVRRPRQSPKEGMNPQHSMAWEWPSAASGSSLVPSPLCSYGGSAAIPGSAHRLS